jgi:hypothetical protein
MESAMAGPAGGHPDDASGSARVKDKADTISGLEFHTKDVCSDREEANER